MRCSVSHKTEGTAGRADSGPGEQQEHSLGRAPGCLMSCTWQLGQSQVSGPSLLLSSRCQARLLPGSAGSWGSARHRLSPKGSWLGGVPTASGHPNLSRAPDLEGGPQTSEKRLGDRMPPHRVLSAVLAEALLYTEVGWTEAYRWDGLEEVAGRIPSLEAPPSERTPPHL